MINMPPWVFTVELGIATHNILTTLDARFAICYGDAVEFSIFNAEERTLTAQLLLAHFLFHDVSILFF